jgi:hypothetical protein
MTHSLRCRVADGDALGRQRDDRRRSLGPGARDARVRGEWRIDPEGVDRLLGADDPPAWRFPTALFLVAVFGFVLLAGVAALGSRVASGSATLALPLLSRQPCVIMLALVPAGVGFLGLRAAGRMRAAWRAASSRERFQGPRSIA